LANRNAIIAGSFLSLLIFLGCQNKQVDIDALVGPAQAQEDKAEDVTILLSKNGKLEGRLFAQEFIRNDVAKPPFTDLKGHLRLEIYNDSLELESTLTARYARYYEDQGNILVRDSIVVVNKKGEKLTTEELVWNQKLGRFYTDKLVHISTATQVIFGHGMEANQDFSWYQLHNIEGVLQVDKSAVPLE
jgi:LPS export ABC transporter protein LptC